MIAAAGLGSRLGHGVPKCMLEIRGRTVLSRLIETLSAHTDTIHVVVGYREELVIDHVAAHHRDVVLVRNPDYRTTNTITSLRIGSRGIRGPVLFVDGDTVIEPGSLATFVATAATLPILMAVAPASSEHAVFTTTTGDGASLEVTSFDREVAQPFEWANVLVADRAVLAEGDGFVYEALEPLLPLAAAPLELAEIDTESDLEQALRTVARWESATRP